MLSQGERRAAAVAARFAARRGLPITMCPPAWKAGHDARARALRGIWIRVYLRHRPELRGAVDYTG